MEDPADKKDHEPPELIEISEKEMSTEKKESEVESEFDIIEGIKVSRSKQKQDDAILDVPVRGQGSILSVAMFPCI